MRVPTEGANCEQAWLVYKVDGQVELLQRLAPLQVLDARDVVDCKVQVLQLLRFVI